MKTRTPSQIRIAVLLAVAALGTSPAVYAQTASAGHAEGRLVLRLAASVSDLDYARLLKRNMARELSRLDAIGLRVVEVPAGFESELARLLSADARIALAEPDAIAVPSELTANDPLYASSWHLAKIASPSAWDFSLGAGVTVAVIDSGIESDHPDLVSKLLPGRNVVSGNEDTDDSFGHGTKVAGIVGAASDNSLGATAVAWDVSLMPVKVTNSADGVATTSDIAAGLIWAADHGARVANVSYNVTNNGGLSSAADYFRAAGGVVVVPSGNDGTNNQLADNPYMITVSATDSNDMVPYWSNYGRVIDLSAPGAVIATTSLNGFYQTNATGTSFAAPVVSGVVALMLAANPELTPEAIEALLEQSADDLGTPGRDDYYGAGRVNAAAAVQAALAWAPVLPDEEAPSVSIDSPTAGATVAETVSVAVSAADNEAVTEVRLYVAGALVATDSTAPYAFDLDTLAYANGSLALVAHAYDAAGNEGMSAQVTVTVDNDLGDLVPPTAQITSPTWDKRITSSLAIKSNASDDVQLASMTLYGNGVQLCTGPGPNLDCTWNTANLGRGYHYVKLIATDAAGNTKSHEVRVKK